MSSKQILFNTEMVKAILDGRKTQTRRVFSKTQLKYFDYAQKLGEMSSLDNLHENDFAYILQFSQYKVGGFLWVRESAKILDYVDCDAHFQIVYQFSSDGKIESLTHDDLINKYKLEDHEFESKYLSKKYIEKLQKIPNGCFKEMARIFLKVTNVRVERLQDITFNDIRREGIFPLGDITEDSNNYISHIQELWTNLWNSTSKDGYKWEDNPYVFVYDFERVEKQ